MKKFLFWTALASVALTGCVKNDVEPNPNLGQDVEITFNAPVVGKITKAPVPGELSSSYDINEDFVVTAWSHKNPFDLTNPAVYFEQIVAKHNDAIDNDNNPYIDDDIAEPDAGAWALTTKYYWPKTHYLTFSAFSPAELIDGTTYADAAETDLATGITLTNVKTPTDINAHYDLLYSDRVYDQTERGYTHTNNIYYGVDVLFNHAFASVNVEVNWDKEYGGTNKIVIKDICFENVGSRATFKENVDSESLVNSSAKDKATWSTPDQTIPSISIETDPAYELQLTTTPQPFGIPALFIPQDLKVGTQRNLKVVYDITNASNKTLEETIYFNLSDVQLTDGAGTTYAWKIGRRYTYTLTFTLNEILLAPSVEGWDTESAEVGSDDLI